MGEGQAFSVDAMLGIAYTHLSAGVTLFDPVNGNEIGLSSSINLIDPMLGTRVGYAFSKKFGISAVGEVGGFGASSKIQGIVQGGVGYNFTDWFQLSAAFKYWYFKYEDNSKPLNTLSQTLYGPLVGVQFKY